MENNKINRRNFLETGLTAAAALTFGNSWAMDSFLYTRLLSSVDSPLKEGILDIKVFSEGWKIRAINPGNFTIAGINNKLKTYEKTIQFHSRFSGQTLPKIGSHY